MDNYSSYSHPENLIHQSTISHPSYPSQSQYQPPSAPSYPSSTPRTASAVANPTSLLQPTEINAPLPSEYDLISQTPEERAVLLEVLRERRRVQELELKLLEERRREREAAMAAASNPHQPAPPPLHLRSSEGYTGWANPQAADDALGRFALSAFGARNVKSPTADYRRQHSLSQPPPLQRDGPPPTNSQYIYDSNQRSLERSPPGVPSVSDFTRLPPGLGLAPSPLPSGNPYALAQQSQAQDSYGNYATQHHLTQVEVTGSPSSSRQGSSPASAGVAYGPNTTSSSYGAAATLGLWNSPREMAPSSTLSGAVPAPTSAGNATLYDTRNTTFPGDLDLNPLHLFDERAQQQQGNTYAVSSGGSNYDEPSPPHAHFYPTPPQQHLQHPDPGPAYQPHPSTQVKHARLSGSAPNIPTYNPTATAQGFGQVTASPPSNFPATGGHESGTSTAGGKKPKKVLLERQITCQTCNTPVCKLLLRGTAEELSIQYDPFYECKNCVPGSSLTNGTGGFASSGTAVAASGPRTTRKRTRQTEDTSMPTVCDVCIRTIGRGGLVPRIRSTPLAFAVEVICISCSNKYSRCSDCGGGSGRVGVGKWRAKELFENGRKTCRLPHVRVGGGELEMSVWEIPWDVQSKKEHPAMLQAVRTLWSERVFARLAIPEVLEGGDEDWSASGTAEPPERTYGDVEEVINRGWPAREKVLCTAPSLNHDHFRRYLGLSWAKTRARRERAAGKLPDPARYAEGDNDVVMENIRRTAILVPPASTLVGMWLADWDMRNRTVLLSHSAPFEASDAEDKNIVGVGEVMTRVVQDWAEYNAAHPEAPIGSPQHLWIATRSISALGNARMNDTLTRRRGFVPVDEYVSLHPGVDRSIFASVPDGHGWLDEPSWIKNPEGEIEVLVRYLGDELDMLRLDELKDVEYGRRSKEAQISNRTKKVTSMMKKN